MPPLAPGTVTYIQPRTRNEQQSTLTIVQNNRNRTLLCHLPIKRPHRLPILRQHARKVPRRDDNRIVRARLRRGAAQQHRLARAATAGACDERDVCEAVAVEHPARGAYKCDALVGREVDRLAVRAGEQRPDARLRDAQDVFLEGG